LILQGSLGTGKTRLISKILWKISKRSESDTNVLYTTDQKSLSNDEMLIEFITEMYDALVIEDADHLLIPRADGNECLHKILSVADEIVRAQSRKIIFSTNLPNINDLDDALIRPSRCFELVHLRKLSLEESTILANNICADLSLPINTVKKRLHELSCDTYTLAEIDKIISGVNYLCMANS